MLFRSWAFKLRPGVKFHDGTPLTAADVVFSLKRAQAPSSQMKSLLSSVREVVAVDPLIVHIRTQGPDLVLPNNLTKCQQPRYPPSPGPGRAHPTLVHSTLPPQSTLKQRFTFLATWHWVIFLTLSTIGNTMFPFATNN